MGVFSDVHFVYPSRPAAPVLQGVTLEAKAGETLALVGSSASGKSTVLRLLVHLYEPSRGSILLDNEHVQRLDQRFLCSRVSMVSQEPSLFRGSVEANIRYAVSEPREVVGPGRWQRWWHTWHQLDLWGQGSNLQRAA